MSGASVRYGCGEAVAAWASRAGPREEAGGRGPLGARGGRACGVGGRAGLDSAQDWTRVRLRGARPVHTAHAGLEEFAAEEAPRCLACGWDPGPLLVRPFRAGFGSWGTSWTVREADAHSSWQQWGFFMRRKTAVNLPQKRLLGEPIVSQSERKAVQFVAFGACHPIFPSCRLLLCYLREELGSCSFHSLLYKVLAPLGLRPSCCNLNTSQTCCCLLRNL